MNTLNTIKTAIILYTAVTIIEQLLEREVNINFLFPSKKKHQSNRNKQTSDLMGML
ncbi:hypothetical protein [Staphylococcus sp. Mo2-1]